VTLPRIEGASPALGFKVDWNPESVTLPGMTRDEERRLRSLFNYFQDTRLELLKDWIQSYPDATSFLKALRQVEEKTTWYIPTPRLNEKGEVEYPKKNTRK
jgi:hypothetical protein